MGLWERWSMTRACTPSWQLGVCWRLSATAGGEGTLREQTREVAREAAHEVRASKSLEVTGTVRGFRLHAIGDEVESTWWAPAAQQAMVDVG